MVIFINAGDAFDKTKEKMYVWNWVRSGFDVYVYLIALEYGNVHIRWQ